MYSATVPTLDVDPYAIYPPTTHHSTVPCQIPGNHAPANVRSLEANENVTGLIETETQIPISRVQKLYNQGQNVSKNINSHATPEDKIGRWYVKEGILCKKNQKYSGNQNTSSNAFS